MPTLGELIQDGWKVVVFPSKAKRDEFVKFIANLVKELKTIGVKDPGLAATDGKDDNSAFFKYDKRYKLSAPNLVKVHRGVVLSFDAADFE